MTKALTSLIFVICLSLFVLGLTFFNISKQTFLANENIDQYTNPEPPFAFYGYNQLCQTFKPKTNLLAPFIDLPAVQFNSENPVMLNFTLYEAEVSQIPGAQKTLSLGRSLGQFSGSAPNFNKLISEQPKPFDYYKSLIPFVRFNFSVNQPIEVIAENSYALCSDYLRDDIPRFSIQNTYKKDNYDRGAYFVYTPKCGGGYYFKEEPWADIIFKTYSANPASKPPSSNRDQSTAKKNNAAPQINKSLAKVVNLTTKSITQKDQVMIYLKWEYPADQAISGFIVVEEINGQRRELGRVNNTTKEYFIETANCSATVKYLIYAFTQDAISPPQETEQIDLPNYAPAMQKPKNIKVAKLGRYQATICWEEPPNKPQSYTVSLNENSTNKEVMHTKIEGQQTCHTVTGLKPNKHYRFTIISNFLAGVQSSQVEFGFQTPGFKLGNKAMFLSVLIIILLSPILIVIKILRRRRKVNLLNNTTFIISIAILCGFSVVASSLSFVLKKDSYFFDASSDSQVDQSHQFTTAESEIYISQQSKMICQGFVPTLTELTQISLLLTNYNRHDLSQLEIRHSYSNDLPHKNVIGTLTTTIPYRFSGWAQYTAQTPIKVSPYSLHYFCISNSNRDWINLYHVKINGSYSNGKILGYRLDCADPGLWQDKYYDTCAKTHRFTAESDLGFVTYGRGKPPVGYIPPNRETYPPSIEGWVRRISGKLIKINNKYAVELEWSPLNEQVIEYQYVNRERSQGVERTYAAKLPTNANKYIDTTVEEGMEYRYGILPCYFYIEDQCAKGYATVLITIPGKPTNDLSNNRTSSSDSSSSKKGNISRDRNSKTGNDSNISTNTLLTEQSPPIVNNLQAKSLREGVELTWEYPADQIITEFIIKISEENQLISWHKAPPEKRSFIVTNLKRNTLYHFTVIAKGPTGNLSDEASVSAKIKSFSVNQGGYVYWWIGFSISILLLAILAIALNWKKIKPLIERMRRKKQPLAQSTQNQQIPPPPKYPLT